MEDSGEAFDEHLRVETGAYWIHELFGSRPPLRRVRVTSTGLEIDGDPPISREQILAATRVQEGEPPAVVIVVRSRRRITIEVPVAQEGVRLLAALGPEINRENEAIPVNSHYERLYFKAWKRRLTILLGVMLLVVGGMHFEPRLPLMLLGIAAIYLQTRLLPRVTIGRDGISISRMVFFSLRPRYVSFRDVVAVKRYGGPIHRGIRLELRDELVDAPLDRVRDGGDEVSKPLQEIREALEAWRKETPTEASDSLVRRGRTTREWIGSLKQLGATEEAVYRVASVDRDTLFTIVEDPANEAVSRAAAAVALGAALGEEDRARLEASAKLVAEPRLRVAMNKVLEQGTEEEIGAALDELDRSDTSKRT